MSLPWTRTQAAPPPSHTYCLQVLLQQGYTLDQTFSNLRIGLGLLAILIACVGQFYPAKYPANFWLLVFCVSTYTVLSGSISLLGMLVEKDQFAFTQPSSDGVALVLGSKMPRHQDVYTLHIAPRAKSATA
jgi:hypothetical protein